jgi:type IV pilus assembly protein PilA
VSKKWLSKKGFTLVELVVVVAILAILAAVAVPIIASTIDKATLTTALSNAETLDNSLRLAEADVDTSNDATYGELVVDATLEIKDVIEIQALQKTCDAVTYKGKDVVFVWDYTRKGVYLMYVDSKKDIETNNVITNYTIITKENKTKVANLS